MLRVFVRLGLMSFGGPSEHLGYFGDEFPVKGQSRDELAVDPTVEFVGREILADNMICGHRPKALLKAKHKR